MTKKIVKRTDANNETLYFYTHADAVDVGEGSSTKSLTEVIDDTLHKSAQTLTNAEKTQVYANLGLNGVDDVPTENSNNIVRSGGVKAAIDDIIDDFTNRGFMYKGIAPASAPLGEDKTFYIAKSGDYTAYTGIGDGSFTLNGIAVLTYATTTASGAWTKNDIVLFDEEPTAGSNNLVKSGGVAPLLLREDVELIAVANLTNKGYLDNQGVEHTDNKSAYTEPMLINSGSIVYIKGTTYNIPYYIVTDAVGTFISASSLSASVNNMISFIAEEDIYIRIQGRIGVPRFAALIVKNPSNRLKSGVFLQELSIKGSDGTVIPSLDCLGSVYKKNIPLIVGCVIDKSKGVVLTSSAGHYCTDYIEIQPDSFVIVNGVLTSSVTPIAFYDEDKHFIESEKDSAVTFYSYDYLSSIGAKYFRCSIPKERVESGLWYLSYIPLHLKLDDLEAMTSAVDTLYYDKIYNSQILTKRGYISAAGNIYSSNTHYYSDPIQMAAGTKLYVTGVGNGVPYFIVCTSDGSFISTPKSSSGYNSHYIYHFTNDTYIILQGSVIFFHAFTYIGSTVSEHTSEYVQEFVSNNVPFVTRLRSADATYSEESTFCQVTIDTVMYYKDITRENKTVYADGDATSHSPKTFTLNAIGRSLVIDKDDNIVNRINHSAIKPTDLVLLIYDTNVHQLVGGALYADYLKKKIDKMQGGRGVLTQDNFNTAYEYYGWKRAEQFAKIKWTPLKPIPKASSDDYFEAGVEQTGMPYSSLGEIDKRVGHDVSLHTFMTCLHNPYSLLYTENVRYGHSQSAYGKTYYGASNSGVYMGVVCSGYTAYATGLEIPYVTSHFALLPELFEAIYDQSANGIKMLDIVWTPGHVRLINSVWRKNGVVEQVLTSEEAQPKVVYRTYTAEAFNNLIRQNGAIIYRYKDLYKLTSYEPSPFVAVDDEVAEPFEYNDDICTFAGDKACFRENDLIYIHCLNLQYPQMELYKDDVLIETITLATDTRAALTDDNLAYAVNLSESNLGYGMYKARLKNDSEYSDYTYFEVINCELSLNGDTASFSSQNAVAVYWSWIEYHNPQGAGIGSMEALTGSSGTFDVSGRRKDGYPLLKVLFQGQYGRVAAEYLEERT